MRRTRTGRARRAPRRSRSPQPTRAARGRRPRTRAASAAASRRALLPASDPVASADPPPAETSDETPAPDLPGGALVWQSGDAFRLTNAAVETTRLFARPADGAQLAGVADFDADGQGDLLWVSATSQLAYMPGERVARLGPGLAGRSLGTLVRRRAGGRRGRLRRRRIRGCVGDGCGRDPRAPHRAGRRTDDRGSRRRPRRPRSPGSPTSTRTAATTSPGARARARSCSG